MDSGPSDETLLRAVAERDMGAFRTLYERHAGWLAIRLAVVSFGQVVPASSIVGKMVNTGPGPVARKAGNHERT